MRRNLIFCAVLIALTLAVYWPVCDFDFIDFDDPEFIGNNEVIKSGLNWTTLRYAFTTAVVGNWHPVTTLSHALDCQLFGTDPGPHHLVNVAIHAVNSALLFLMLVHLTDFNSRLERRAVGFANSAPFHVSLCLFVAGLFAVHPLRVESVAWIAERKDVLSGFFFMLTLLAYGSYVTRRSTQKTIGLSDNRTIGRGHKKTKGPPDVQSSMSQSHSPIVPWSYCLSLLFFALGLMSKPMLVTVPFVLLLLDFWPLKRLPAFSFRILKPLLIEKIPFFLLTACSSLLTILSQKHGMASAGALDVGSRLGNAAISYVAYSRKFFWPSDLAVFYPHSLLNSADKLDYDRLIISAVVLLVITAIALAKVRQRPCLFVGWFWFVGMLVPVIGIVQVGEQAMADRYTYLPTIGLSFCVAWLFRIVAVRLSRPEILGCYSLMVIILAACVTTTRHQLKFWCGTIPLFERALALTGANPNAEFALGVGLEKTGQFEAARKQFESVLNKDPFHIEARYNLGFVLMKEQRWDAAISRLQQVLESKPNHFDARASLAAALASKGRYEQAAGQYDAALRIKPDSAEALNNFAWLLATAPDPAVRDGAKAVVLAERACELTKWEQTMMIGTLAAAYARAGRFDDAVEAAEKAKTAARVSGEKDLVKKNDDLLQLYRRGQAFSE